MQGFKAWTRSLLVAVWTTLLVAIGALAQPVDPRVPRGDADTLRSIVKYVEGESHRTADLLLEFADLPPGINEEQFRSMSILRQCETIYLGARAFDPEGGGRSLAMLSRALAQRWRLDSILHDPRFAGLAPREKIERVPTARIPSEATIDAAPLAEQTQLRALLSYIDGHREQLGALMDLGADSAQAERLLRDMKFLDAAQTQLTRLAPESRTAALKRLAERTIEWSVSARHDAAFVKAAREVGISDVRLGSAGRRPPEPPDVEPPAPPHPRPPDPAPPAPRGAPAYPTYKPGDFGTRGGPNDFTPRSSAVNPSRTISVPPSASGRVGAMAARYASFRSGHYPTGSSMTFRSVTRSARGWGGGVLGNDVADRTGIGPVSRVMWVPGTDGLIGQIEVQDAQGAVYRFSPVYAEDARAARLIVFGAQGDLPEGAELDPYSPENAIGVVSLVLDSATTYLDWPIECAEQPWSRLVARRYDVVLHPALLDTELGWALVHCDSLLIARSLLRWQCEEGGATGDALKQIDELVGTEAGNWKLIDRSLAVSLDREKLVVGPMRLRAFEKGAALPASAIDVVAFQADLLSAEDAKATKFVSVFQRSAATLATHSVDFHRLDRFARTLALLRWAQAKGATPDGSWPRLQPEDSTAAAGEGELPRTRTPEAIVVNDNALFPAPSLGNRSAYAENLSRATASIREYVLRHAPDCGQCADALDQFTHAALQLHDALNSVEFAGRRASALEAELNRAYLELVSDDRRAADQELDRAIQKLEAAWRAYADAPYGSEDESAAMKEANLCMDALEAVLRRDEGYARAFSEHAAADTELTEQTARAARSFPLVAERIEDLEVALIASIDAGGIDDDVARVRTARVERDRLDSELAEADAKIETVRDGLADAVAAAPSDVQDQWRQLDEREAQAEKQYYDAPINSDAERAAEIELDRIETSRREATQRLLPELMPLIAERDQLADRVGAIEQELNEIDSRIDAARGRLPCADLWRSISEFLASAAAEVEGFEP